MSGVVLVTRPGAAGARTAATLEARGFATLQAPLFALEPTGEEAPDGLFQALAVTSANGAEGLAPDAVALAPEAPAFAVGDRTAEALRAAGFTHVVSAAGDQGDLAAVMAAALKPRSRILLAFGDPHKPGLAEALAGAGHKPVTWVRYRSVAANALPEAARAALLEGQLSAVLHYSRRAAETFVTLAHQAGLAPQMRALRHVAISEDAAEPARRAGAQDVVVAATPDEEAMLALLPEPGGSASVEAPIATPEVVAAAVATPEHSPQPEPTALPRLDPEPPAREPARSGFGAAALLLAGLVGGAAGGGFAAFVPSLLGSAPSSPSPALQAVEQRLQRIESAPRPQVAAVDPAIERTAREAASGLAELRQATQALDRRIGEIAARPVPQAGAPAGAAPLDELRAELDRLRAELAPIRQAAEGAQGAAAALQPRLAEAERLVRAQPQGNGPSDAAARLVLLDRIRALAGQGRAFEAEARALAALGAAGPAMEALSASARAAPPSPALLLAEFRKVRAAMTIDTPAANAGWTDRLLRLTDGLVRVTPVGDRQGATPAAITARMEQALERGDAAQAAALFAQLPEPARRAAEGLGQLLQSRARLDQALGALGDDAVRALSVPRP